MDFRSDFYFAPIQFAISNPEKEMTYLQSSDSMFLTPPVSPLSLNDTIEIKNLETPRNVSPYDSLVHFSEEDLGEGACAISRQNSSAACSSRVILNDIMWDSYGAKRPNSALDIEVSFSPASTPVFFAGQCVENVVPTEELFYLSDEDQCFQAERDMSENKAFVLTLEDNSRPLCSESDEEIDVVSVMDNTMRTRGEKRFEDVQPNCKTCNGNSSRRFPDVVGSDVLFSAARKNRNSKRRKTYERNRNDFSEDGIKTLHNDLEKRRRNDLKNRFNALRFCIPWLRDNERASKIAVLKNSVDLIRQQQEEENKLLEEKEIEKIRNQKLLQKLSKLAKQNSSHEENGLIFHCKT